MCAGPELGSAPVLVRLRTVSGRQLGEVSASTVGDLRSAAAEQGYERCKLVLRGRPLGEDSASLSGCGAEGCDVTVVGARRPAPPPAPPAAEPPRKERWSLWGPAGAPTLGALRGAGPSAPPGSIEVAERTAIPGSKLYAEETARRAAERGSIPPAAVQELVAMCDGGIAEDMAYEMLRQAGGNVGAAWLLAACGKLRPPPEPTFERDLRRSHLVAARQLLRRDPQQLRPLMNELEASHPDMHAAVLASQRNHSLLVALLSRDEDAERAQVEEALPAVAGALGQLLQCAGLSGEKLRAAAVRAARGSQPADGVSLKALLKASSELTKEEEQRKSERLAWLRRASTPRPAGDGAGGVSESGDDDSADSPQTPA